MYITRRRLWCLALALAWLPVPCSGRAQCTRPFIVADARLAPADLPDAPGPSPSRATPASAIPDVATPGNEASNSLFGVTARRTTGTPAKKFHLVVHSGEYGVPLTSREKLELSIMSRFTLSDIASTAFSAGWSQMLDHAPHYGTDSGAFGDRLGALALKQTSQSVFSYGLYANLFHDDPRYYVMGRQKRPAVRALYSASRLFIAQKDDGGAAINWPKFAGIASATALTNAYYPAQDHGFAHGASAFGLSLGTSVLNNEIHEFLGDGIRMVRQRIQ